ADPGQAQQPQRDGALPGHVGARPQPLAHHPGRPPLHRRAPRRPHAVRRRTRVARALAGGDPGSDQARGPHQRGVCGRAHGHPVPYRAAGLDRAVLAGAETTHPHLLAGGRARVSPRYSGTATALAIAGERRPAAPADAEEIKFGAGDLPLLRRLVRERALSAGLPGERAEDLMIAVNEVATNTVSHTEAPGVLRMWRDAAGFVCEICDTGHIPDPLAGRRPAAAAADGGHGLRVVN